MYYLKEKSLRSEEPIFQKLEEGCIFFPEKSIAYDFANTGYYETLLIKWCKENFCDKEKTFLDIGAHVGSYSVELANYFKNVHSFESCTRTYNFLCANIALNKLDYKIKTYNFGLGDENAKKDFFFRNEDGGGNGFFLKNEDHNFNKISVDMKTLDSLNIEDKIGFIKIDVEGFELNVLKGAENTLKKNNFPKFIFECWRNYEGKELLFSYIKNLGYKIITLYGFDEMFLAEYEYSNL